MLLKKPGGETNARLHQVIMYILAGTYIVMGISAQKILLTMICKYARNIDFF